MAGQSPILVAPEQSARPGRRPVSIRRSLFWNLLFLILLVALTLATVTSLTGQRTARLFSRSLIQRASDLMELELQQFFRPMQNLLRLSLQWATSGDMDLTDPQALRRRWSPLLARLGQISSINTADEEGNNFMLLQTGNQWMSRERHPAQWGNRLRWQRWTTDQAEPEVWWEESDYDPRQQPWFQGAMRHRDPLSAAEPGLFWTRPYRLRTTQEPGVTVSQAVQIPGRPGWTVLALDILLTDLSDYTRRLEPSENGFVFLASAEGALIGLPRGSLDNSSEWEKPDLAAALEEVSQPAGAAAVRAWNAQGRRSLEPLQFKSEGQGWWAGFRPVSLGVNRDFWIGVVVPVEDFMADVWRMRANVLAVITGSLLVAMIMVARLSRKYAQPLEALVTQNERIQVLDLTPHPTPPSRLLEVSALTQAQERMRRTLESFARYVPLGVVRELVQRGEAAQLGGRTETLTVMFSDIKGFTRVAEEMPPEALSLYLADYFQQIQTVLDEHHATIDKFIGDSVLAFWGAPAPDPGHAQKAVRAVLAVDQSLRTWEIQAIAAGRPPLPTCFGLATGPLLVGNIGSPSRLNYSVMGHTVNLASRLEGLNRFYGTRIIAAQAVRDAAGADTLVWRRLDRVVAKGQLHPVDIYELVGRAGEVAEPVLQRNATYEQALASLQQRQFQTALDLLRSAGLAMRDDLSFQQLAERCQGFLTHPPPDDWDTSRRFREK